MADRSQMQRGTAYHAAFLETASDCFMEVGTGGEVKMDERNKRCLIIAAVLLVFAWMPLPARAEETAEFHVQTAEVQEDGTIRVSVYLTNTVNLGGIDAELAYDPSKATYVDSGLGNSFTDGYGETNCVEEESIIKCVTVYTESKAAHGELMYAVFKLNGAESYQPEFRVVDMLDSSTDLNEIPYKITYQQADGKWADKQDASGKAAKPGVAAEAREAYGADEDQENRPGTPSQAKAADGSGEAENADKAPGENTGAEKTGDAGGEAKSEQGTAQKKSASAKPADEKSDNEKSDGGKTEKSKGEKDKTGQDKAKGSEAEKTGDSGEKDSGKAGESEGQAVKTAKSGGTDNAAATAGAASPSENNAGKGMSPVWVAVATILVGGGSFAIWKVKGKGKEERGKENTDER